MAGHKACIGDTIALVNDHPNGIYTAGNIGVVIRGNEQLYFSKEEVLCEMQLDSGRFFLLPHEYEIIGPTKPTVKPNHKQSVEEFLRKQTDDNLRGVFG